MKKEKFVQKYGEAAYTRKQQQDKDWVARHRKERRVSQDKWRKAHPEKVKAISHKGGRKGGKYYEQQCEYRSRGTPHERSKLRRKHGHKYHPYKQIIAPGSQIHHEWVPGTSKYRGIALVEKDQHQHGFIDVIQILEGEITLFTESHLKIS